MTPDTKTSESVVDAIRHLGKCLRERREIYMGVSAENVCIAAADEIERLCALLRPDAEKGERPKDLEDFIVWLEGNTSIDVETRSVQHGWKLVPVEPTEKMISHAEGYTDFLRSAATPPTRKGLLDEWRIAYKAMLAAAPPPPAVGDSGDFEERMYASARDLADEHFKLWQDDLPDSEITQGDLGNFAANLVQELRSEFGAALAPHSPTEARRVALEAIDAKFLRPIIEAALTGFELAADQYGGFNVLSAEDAADISRLLETEIIQSIDISLLPAKPEEGKI